MNHAAFLPEGYQSPKLSNSYTKLQDGENKIRILTKPILGWEDWNENKPVRYRYENKPAKPFDSSKPIKHFWSFVVWNYNEEQIQILHITQATIRNSIEMLCNDNDWGAPFNYDIKIVKKGEGVKTEYAINPLPHKPINPYIIDCFKEKPCNLEAMYNNDDPFSSEWSHYTKGVFDENENTNTISLVPKEEIELLKMAVSECDESFQKHFGNLLRNKGINQIEDLSQTPSLFEMMKKCVVGQRDVYQMLQNENIFCKVG